MAAVVNEDTKVAQQTAEELVADLLAWYANDTTGEKEKYFSDEFMLASRIFNNLYYIAKPEITTSGEQLSENENDLVSEVASKLNLVFKEVALLLKIHQEAASVLTHLYSQSQPYSTLEFLDQFLVPLAELYHATGVSLIDNMSRWYDGLNMLEKSLAIRRQLNDLNARADTIYQIARAHHLIGNLDKARTHYRDALRLYEHTGNQRGVAACKSGLGHLMTQNGFLDEAIGDLKSARQIYRKLGDKQEVSKVNEVLQLAKRVKERQPA